MACPCGTLIDTDDVECWDDDDVARCQQCRDALDESKDRTVKGGADCSRCGGKGWIELTYADHASGSCTRCNGTGREPEVLP